MNPSWEVFDCKSGETSVHETSDFAVKLLKWSLEFEDVFRLHWFMSMALLEECAIIIIEDKLIVYGKKESVNIKVSNSKFIEELLNGFHDLFKEVHGSHSNKCCGFREMQKCMIS